MDFGDAIRALKDSKRVARAGWNGKGMWLVLITPVPRESSEISATNALVKMPVFGESGHMRMPDGAVVLLSDWLTGEGVNEAGEGSRYRLLPWIGMKTAADCFVPWLASQTDMLAEDWEIVV